MNQSNESSNESIIAAGVSPKLLAIESKMRCRANDRVAMGLNDRSLRVESSDPPTHQSVPPLSHRSLSLVSSTNSTTRVAEALNLLPVRSRDYRTGRSSRLTPLEIYYYTCRSTYYGTPSANLQIISHQRSICSTPPKTAAPAKTKRCSLDRQPRQTWKIR